MMIVRKLDAVRGTDVLSTTKLLQMLLLIASQLWPVESIQGTEESVTEWINNIRFAQTGVTSFVLSFGDSLSLDCRGMSHAKKMKIPFSLEWRLHERPLTDEGPTGRVSLLEDNGRLTVENVDERDGGLYAAYVKTRALSPLLDISLSTKSNSSVVQAGDKFIGADLILCLFVVRVEVLRVFTIREGEIFKVNSSTWLQPLSDTLDALRVPQVEWGLDWYRDGEASASCPRIGNCQLLLNGSKELTAGGWSLELRSLVDSKSQRRVLLEFTVVVLPALNYFDSFPLDSHQHYMVSGTLMVAMFLLSLHLFNNLNWTPFAFDVLPDQVSPKAVLDQAGVFLKESRI